MKLFHSFRRPRKLQALGQATGGRDAAGSVNSALNIIHSILEFGLLCTPERLNIFPDKETQNGRKRELLASGHPEYSHIQSRFCLTLCNETELFEPKIRNVAPIATTTAAETGWLSHADLFGPFSISFDPIASRRFGIIPTNYYAPTDLFGNRYTAGGGTTPGLNIQMIQRLKELRELGILLAMIEKSIEVDGHALAGGDVLDALGLTLPFEEEVVGKIHRLSKKERSKVFELFNIDRESALSLVSFIEMMLGAFQETDSKSGAGTLAFYQQREWRLIHHMRAGMTWYCLGSQPPFRDPLAGERTTQILNLRQSLAEIEPRSEEYFKHCWLLEKVDDLPVRNFLVSIIVPRVVVNDVKKLTYQFECGADVIAAEDFGYQPHSTSEPG